MQWHFFYKILTACFVARLLHDVLLPFNSVRVVANYDILRAVLPWQVAKPRSDIHMSVDMHGPCDVDQQSTSRNISLLSTSPIFRLPCPVIRQCGRRRSTLWVGLPLCDLSIILSEDVVVSPAGLSPAIRVLQHASLVWRVCESDANVYNHYTVTVLPIGPYISRLWGKWINNPNEQKTNEEWWERMMNGNDGHVYSQISRHDDEKIMVTARKSWQKSEFVTIHRRQMNAHVFSIPVSSVHWRNLVNQSKTGDFFYFADLPNS